MADISFSETEGKQAFEKIQVIESSGRKKVFVNGKQYMSWETRDQTAQRVAIAQLYTCNIGSKEELSRAFGVDVKSIYNYVKIFQEGGMQNLISEQRGPKGSWKLTSDVRRKILLLLLRENITEYKKLKYQLKKRWNISVSIPSIRQVLLENGFVKESIEYPESKQGELFEWNKNQQLEIGFYDSRERFNWNGESHVDNNSIYDNLKLEKQLRSSYSQSQRIYLDQLEQGIYSAYAGGLLFACLIERYRLLPIIKNIIDIDTYEGYSLDELCLTLFYFNLFRFESMENFKTVYPEEFGILLGKSTGPSIYTLRRFLHKVRELGKSEELIDEFAKEYLQKGLVIWGVLYIDGHFIPYYGFYTISKGWHGVRKIPMKGTYNFLSVDEKFSPVLFLVRPASEDLLKKIPEIVLKAKEFGRKAGIGEEQLEKLTIIFDREGYSAELFRTLDGREDENGKFKVRFITWGKYSDRWVNDIEDEKFDKSVTITYEIKEEEQIKYFETKQTMKKYGKIRAIVIERVKDKHRVAVYTNDEEGEAEEIVQLIGRRWGEENLIKELMRKYFIDYSPGYVIEEMEEQPMVENPMIKELKQKRSQLKSELAQHKSKFGHEVLEEMEKDANWEEIKKKRIATMADIAVIRSQLTLLDIKIDKHPEQVRFDEAYGKKLVELNYEKKRFLDCIKIFTYNIEKKMCEMLFNYYDKKKEIWPALAMIIKRGGYIKLEDGQLKVRLSRFKNSEIDYAARRLCEDLNQMNAFTLDKFRFPIRYEVV